MSADIYIIAVTDSSVAAVAGQLKLQEQIVVHTAAAVSKEALHECSKNFGILYPLQSLIKEIPTPSIPVLTDSNNEITAKALIKFCSGWADHVQAANDEERLKLHIAAVFVNNFTNYIYTVTEQYCKKEQLKFNMLYPLIEETITRLKFYSPSLIQTGPATRADHITISKHTEMLQNYPELHNLYNVFTNMILSSGTIDKDQETNIS